MPRSKIHNTLPLEPSPSFGIGNRQLTMLGWVHKELLFSPSVQLEVGGAWMNASRRATDCFEGLQML